MGFVYNEDLLKYNKKAIQRGVSEWLMVQSWKGCVGAIPPWVRIPSPLKRAEVGIAEPQPACLWNEGENLLIVGSADFRTE